MFNQIIEIMARQTNPDPCSEKTSVISIGVSINYFGPQIIIGIMKSNRAAPCVPLDNAVSCTSSVGDNTEIALFFFQCNNVIEASNIHEAALISTGDTVRAAG